MLKPRPEEVALVDVQTFDFASVMRNPAPPNYFASKYSLPHAAAVLITRGGLSFSDIDDSALEDPVIAALRPLVRIAADPAMTARSTPTLRPARVTLTLEGRAQRYGGAGEFRARHAEAGSGAAGSREVSRTGGWASDACRDGRDRSGGGSLRRMGDDGGADRAVAAARGMTCLPYRANLQALWREKLREGLRPSLPAAPPPTNGRSRTLPPETLVANSSSMPTILGPHLCSPPKARTGIVKGFSLPAESVCVVRREGAIPLEATAGVRRAGRRRAHRFPLPRPGAHRG